MPRLDPALLLASLLWGLACETPPVAPGLDEYSCDGGLCAAPGVIEGTLSYAGAARGDAILLLFDTSALPPPDGTGTGATAIARVPAATLFKGAVAGQTAPFSAPFTFSQVPSGRSYQIRAFIDASHQFNPLFDYTQQPRAGDPVGGHGEPGPGGQTRLLAVAVGPGQRMTGVAVALTQTLAFDPPSFEIVGGSQTLDPKMDQPARLRLRIARLAAQDASFEHARFAMELDRDGQGNRRSTLGDGLDDVFPRVFLRQISALDGQGGFTPVTPGSAAVVPCRVIPVPVLPALVDLPQGSTPLAQDLLELFVEPFAVAARDLARLPEIPAGRYQVVVVQRSGQLWTVPNQLGDGAGTPYFAASQAESITFAPAGLPGNSVSGTVAWRGDPSIRSGNIVVQAYRDDPFHPPSPLGAAAPVRVQIIPPGAVVHDAQGFSAPYRIDGLPEGNYFVQALDDVDGNFSPLNLLATPTSGDLVGAVLDGSTGRPASIAVRGNVTGRDVTLVTRLTADPPAFELDPATAAMMPADQVMPVRFSLRARALSFPAGRAPAPHFAVQLVRDVAGGPVDSDLDGLPDVWPRVFLVRLEAADPAGLTQYVSPDLHLTRTQVIPAAIDPTPFLPALQPQSTVEVAPVLTDRLTVVVRPSLLDASLSGAPAQRLPALEPGLYKIVLVSQSGQVWQIPNEAGSAALDASVVCPSAASSCAPGTVQTQSQSAAFRVGPPSRPAVAGAITGSLAVSGAAAGGAYVFAFAANAAPPFGRPLAVDFHSAAELSAGTVTYALPNLPAGDYVVTAVAAKAAGFGPSLPFLAMAPGPSAVAGGPVRQTVDASPAPLDVAVSTALTRRPSFELVDSNGAPLSADVSISFGGAPSASIRLQPAAILTTGVTAFQPDTSGAFLLTCDISGKPVGGSLSIRLVKVIDGAGLVPDVDGNGKGTVVAAGADPSQFSPGTCTPGFVSSVAPLSVLVANGSSKVSLTDPADSPVAVPLVAGRYAVWVTSLDKQVWRVPNELQAGLLDANALLATPPATRSLLETQQVAVKLAP